MANTHKRGKSFLLLLHLSLLFFLLSSPLVTHSSEEESGAGLEPEPGNESTHHQEVVLQRMEELVKSLGEIVSRLEPLLSQSPPPQGGGTSDGKSRVGEKLKSVSVTKYSPLWSERFQFFSAVKLDSQATCVNVLPFRGYEGVSKYVAVGDDRGKVYVFLRNGDVLAEFDTTVDSPVTAIVSYLAMYKNESVLVTGHHNGEISRHKIVERTTNGVDDYTSLETVAVGGKFEGDRGNLAVTVLEVHHVGRSRYILSSDGGGTIRVYKEGGKFHGSVKPSSRPLAFLKQRLMFLTETGAGSLDLRSMKIRESECEGLNHSLVRNYVFDVTERSKAYGFTSGGDLIHVLLLGDVSNFKCRVRSKRKMDIDEDETLAMNAIKGYLLIVSQHNVYVYNVSSHHYVRMVGPRLIFSAGLDEIKSSFLSHQTGVESSGVPLIASDREKLVVVGLGDGYVGMYRSSLPVFKGEFNTMTWMSPVLIFILFLFGAWQFFAKKKEALTSWGPDDPFVGTTNATSSSSAGNSAPALETSSRNSGGIMDLRTGAGEGMRGATRRYASPPRYSGGAGTTSGSFRPSAVDAGNASRPSSVEPSGYRSSPSELKYRASHMEPPGFPKRRENLFANNQVVDDGN
ncbi:unnamed protein product [Linum tenue]|uniref:Uncharacterized protein n=1 Tax=Linum tenue TaxID=586396 RepID=A0AAV0LR03_9ROSI|nr:unnamed protein product [Linum tenue]